MEQAEELGYQCSLRFTMQLQLFFQGRSLGISKKLAKRLSNASFSIWQLFLLYQFFGLPDGSVGKESAWDPPRDPNAGLTPGSRRSPEEEMTSYSSIAWKIPWTEEPGRLQSKGLQRVRYNWAAKTHTHTHTQLFHLMVRGINTRIWNFNLFNLWNISQIH